ncbi:hypothetical protein NKG99_31240 [Mesorhizobium sp. M1409]|uniref:hypothetical protein n=1 Tax=unclassified Mesorhizobium TaxID=325217 RepID=UPI00333A18C6
MNMAARTDRRVNYRHLAWSVALDLARDAPTLLARFPIKVVAVSLGEKNARVWQNISAIRSIEVEEFGESASIPPAGNA